MAERGAPGEQASTTTNATEPINFRDLSHQLQELPGVIRQVAELSVLPTSVQQAPQRAHACRNCGFVEFRSSGDVRNRSRSSLPLATHPLQLIYADQMWSRDRRLTEPSPEVQTQRRQAGAKKSRRMTSVTSPSNAEASVRKEAGATKHTQKQSRRASRHSRNRADSDVTTLGDDVTGAEANVGGDGREGIVNDAFE